MKYKVVLTPNAEGDLDEILRFIALDNAVAARKFVAGLRANMSTLGEQPKRCPLAPENGFTAWSCAISSIVTIELSLQSTQA